MNGFLLAVIVVLIAIAIPVILGTLIGFWADRESDKEDI